jgi:uncharacterized membrane protein
MINRAKRSELESTMKTINPFQFALAAMSLLFALGAGVGTASADFSFCNKTNKTAYINFVKADSSCSGLGGWSEWGWYAAAPGKCAVVLSGNLKNRYYYYYAHSADNRYIWSGSSSYNWFAQDAAHSGWCIDLAQNVGGKYYKHREVDTGAYTGYTVNLTSNLGCSDTGCTLSGDQCLCAL